VAFARQPRKYMEFTVKFILNILLMLGVSKMTFTSMMLFLYSITSKYLCLVYHLMLSLGTYPESLVRFLLQPSILMTRISLHQNIFLIHHQGITDISKVHAQFHG
ncbi:hypothetical protein ACJX0J_033540, partial [Zea mays]